MSECGCVTKYYFSFDFYPNYVKLYRLFSVCGPYKNRWQPKTIKLLEENKGKLHDIELGNDLGCDTKSTGKTARIDKWDYIKLKNLTHSKDTINRVQR